jgi:hypothetical protein
VTPVYGVPEKRLNQGDVFLDIEFLDRRYGVALAETPTVNLSGLILSHDCAECDKFEAAEKKGLPQELLDAWPVTVAPLVSPNDLDSGQVGWARKDRMPRYFWIPAEGDLPEMFADLWRGEPMPLKYVLEHDRPACLSDQWRQRLWIQMWRLRTGLDLKDVVRPEVFEEGVFGAS